MERPPDATRATVEPAWHRIDESASRGRREPITVPVHDHAQQQRDEAEVAIDLMQREGVDCGNIGYHRHRVAVAPEDRSTAPLSRSSDQWPHHHHDLRCLIEAGVQSVRPRMIATERALESAVGHNRSLRDTLSEVRSRLDDSRRVATARLDHISEMETFMQTMPAVGPWKTVWDQYQSWADEQAEEARDAG